MGQCCVERSIAFSLLRRKLCSPGLRAKQQWCLTPLPKKRPSALLNLAPPLTATLNFFFFNVSACSLLPSFDPVMGFWLNIPPQQMGPVGQSSKPTTDKGASWISDRLVSLGPVPKPWWKNWRKTGRWGRVTWPCVWTNSLHKTPALLTRAIRTATGFTGTRQRQSLEFFWWKQANKQKPNNNNKGPSVFKFSLCLPLVLQHS